MTTIDTQLEEVMAEVTRIMRRAMIGAVKTQDLTMTQLECLVFLKHQDGSHMKDIANNFKISMPSATSLIDKLVSMQLAHREVEKKDRRNVKIMLTSKGKKLLQEGKKKKSEQFNKMLHFLDATEKKNLLTIFQKLAHQMQTYEK